MTGLTGENALKGYISMVLGLMLAMVGFDIIISDAGLGIFFLRPIAATLTVAALAAVAVPVVRALWGAVSGARRLPVPAPED